MKDTGGGIGGRGALLKGPEEEGGQGAVWGWVKEEPRKGVKGVMGSGHGGL